MSMTKISAVSRVRCIRVNDEYNPDVKMRSLSAKGRTHLQ